MKKNERAKKRGNKEGTCHKRPDGRWEASVYLGKDPATGKRIRPVRYGKTRAEAMAKLKKVIDQARQSVKPFTVKDSLESFLLGWLSEHVSVNLEWATYAEYESTCRLHIIPYLGKVKLSKLSATLIRQWQKTLVEEGYSTNQRLRGYRILHNALNFAVKDELLTRNPLNNVTKPDVDRDEREPLPADVCLRMFKEAEKYRLGGIVVVAAMTGIRQGEIFALEWDRIDLEKGEIKVRKSLTTVSKKHAEACGSKTAKKLKRPKTKKSKRTIALDPITIDVLKRRKEAAIAEGFDPAEVPLVFPNTLGNLVHKSNFNRMVWNPIRDTVKVDEDVTLRENGTTFHDLRHTQASLMLSAGGNPKVLQERLGHTCYSTTAKYVHAFKEAQRRDTEKLTAMMLDSGS